MGRTSDKIMFQIKICTTRNTHEFLTDTEPVWVYRVLPQKKRYVHKLSNVTSYKN